MPRQGTSFLTTPKRSQARSTITRRSPPTRGNQPAILPFFDQEDHACGLLVDPEQLAERDAALDRLAAPVHRLDGDLLLPGS